MSYHTLEHTIDSMRGWKRPLWSGTRVYRTKNQINGRIAYLEYEYGSENIAHMPLKGDPSTEVIYIRIR